MTAATMRAARYHGQRDVRIEEVPTPAPPAPGEVIIEVLAAGICGSDAHEYQSGPTLISSAQAPHPVTGHLGPLTLGHEFAGTVTQVGEGVSDLAVGDLVACGAGMSCGACRACRVGRTNLCDSYATLGFHRDGGLARFCAAPASICVKVPGGVSARTAALAQPMSIAIHALRRGRLAAGERALIVGVGGIGVFLTHAAVRAGACVSVVDRDPARLTVARRLGASQALHEAREVGDARVDAVFEVSGVPALVDDALRALRRGGRLVVVGLHKQPLPIALGRIALEELEIIGAVAHVCATDLPEALDALAERTGDWSDVAPQLLTLDELVPRGLRPLADGRAPQIKALIDPRG
jgi:(R,R)-butanediol dehydrogenase / meso-butanediol dehydrogenase / diacetyl reductase